METQAVDQIEDVIKERENTKDDFGPSSPSADIDMHDAPPSQTIPRADKKAKLEKRQIEQRIEEDRERHKRERESIWAVPAGSNAEMNKLWEETSDYGEDEDRLLADEAEYFKVEMDTKQCDHRKPANGERH